MQHLISARTHAQAVERAADVLACPLPTPYVEQVAEAQAFADAAAQVGASAEDLNSAVLDAIEQGRDYHSDKTVQRLMLDRLLTSQSIGERARTRVDQLLATALADHADSILAGWADALDTHTAALAVAAEAGLNLKNSDVVVAKGGNVMHQLHDAQTATV
jgi:hypothetical protein